MRSGGGVRTWGHGACTAAVLGADSAANLRAAHPPTPDPEMPCCAGEARPRRGTQRSCSAAVGRFPHPDDGCSGLTQLAQFYLTCRVARDDRHTARGIHSVRTRAHAAGALMSSDNARATGTTPTVVLKFDPNVMHHGGLGVIRSLGRLGVPVYGVHEGPWAPAANSRYLRGRFFWQPNPDEVERVQAGLLRLADRIGQPAVLVPTDDAGSIFLAEHGDGLREHFLFPDSAAGSPPAGCGQVLAARALPRARRAERAGRGAGVAGGGARLRGRRWLSADRQADHAVDRARQDAQHLDRGRRRASSTTSTRPALRRVSG